MKRFPDFVRAPANRVETSDQAGGGMEGYAFDGADGSQVVIWQNERGGESPVHTHDYDEYCVVIEGVFEGWVGDQPVRLGPGDESYVPAGVPHSGGYTAGYRAIDVFGGRRVARATDPKPKVRS